VPFDLPAELKESIPAEQFNHESVQKYNSLGDFVKGHLELDSYRGRSIGLPAQDAKPEDLEKWAQEQGPKLKDKGFTIAKLDQLRPSLPADPNGYQFKFEGVDDKILASDKLLNDFKPVAHQLGLSNEQAQGLLAHFATTVAPELIGTPPEVIEGDAVMSLLAEKFPNQVEATVENYKRAVDHLKTTNPQLPDFLNSGRAFIDGKEISLGDHPVMIQMLSQLASVFGADYGGNVNGAGPLNKDQAALVAEAEDIIKNENNPKHKLYISGDESTHKYLQELYSKAYPGQVTL
jgi:hypothetical protein